MQTFLPYADFERSARTLDPRRLGKQRVETVQVVRALTWPGYGWANGALVRKDQGHYRPLFPDIPDDLPYVWPVRSEAVLAAGQRKAENEVRRQERALERTRLEVERLRRKRSRAAKKAWLTRRQNGSARS